MERIQRCLKVRYWRKVITYFLACCMFFNTSLPVALAEVVLQPDGVIRGDITVSPLGAGTTQDMTASDGAIGHFSDFDIAAGHVVNCVQPGADASALFRVFSGDGTQIYGRFDATGHIYLIDPAGILFGAGSEINVTRLVASGLNLSDAAFDTILEGGQMEFAGGNGKVTNQATAINGSEIYLIGDKVLNLGPIQAPDGLVVLAAGDEVRLAQDGSNVSVVVNSLREGLSYPDVKNRNRIDAENGTIVLAAGDTFSSAINNASIITAEGGTVNVQGAIIENKGSIDVDGPDGGNINLIATEQVINAPASDFYDSLTADADTTGNGGNITIETEGTVTIGENAVITASGGSTSGNGGTVTITCDDFEIAGKISASPANKIYEPGKLEINTLSNVSIANGANAGVMNTLYENDIEVLSQEATSLIVNAQEGITVKNITDGEITGQFGSIKLHATGDDSAVSFDDNTNTIRTTLGDIVIEAGNGGINVGNLTTGKDLPAEKPAPGQIFLTTTNGGNITTGDLIVRDGWGDGDEARNEIDVKSSGNLTVDGDVIVGNLSDILNVADQRPAEAVISLKADNDVTLNGNVEAHAQGSEVDTSTTKAYIDVLAGNNATMNGDLLAVATSSTTGTADAVITVEAVGDITFAPSADAHAIANDTEVQGTVSDEEPEGYDPADSVDHAQIIINDSAILLVADVFEDISKSASDVVLDVLANDTLEGEATIDSHNIDSAQGSLTTGTAGDKTVLIYNPPESFSEGFFDENGEATVTFTYTVSGKEATGTITLINGLPVAIADKATAVLNRSVTVNVLKNDIDPDSGDVLTTIQGIVSPKNGTLKRNGDGTFTYTPNNGYLGDDSFTYSITDGLNTSSEVEVKITITEKSVITLPANMPPTPGLDSIGKVEIDISGSPALAKWVAKELGIDETMVAVRMANSLASPTDIQPYTTYSNLRKAAIILQDADGSHIAALARVINEFASSTAPPTEEQMAAIAEAIALNADEDSYYAVANEYLDALVTYVGILNSEMGFSTTESVQFVTNKYLGRLAQSQNIGVAAFLAASLAAIGG